MYEVFTEKFAAAMNAMTIGDPLLDETQIPIATASGRDELVELVDDARVKGAEILAGGVAPKGAGWFYPPTVIAGVSPEMRIHLEEAFGPVATVYKVADAREAIDLANGTSFGLSPAWTTDVDEQELFANELEAGGVFLNGMTIS